GPDEQGRAPAGMQGRRLFRLCRDPDQPRRRAGPAGRGRGAEGCDGDRVRQGLRLGQAQRIQGVPASHQPLGARASAPERLMGLMNKVAPRPECKGDAYFDSAEIPINLGDALDLLDEDEALKDVMGTEFAKVYDSVKRNEYKEFLQVISPWEREHLLLNV